MSERKDKDIEVKDFSLSGDVASFTFDIEGKALECFVPSSGIESEIRNILFYESSLFLDAPILDYVSEGSYSTLAVDSFSRGDLLYLKNGKGEKKGLFVVSSEHEDALELEALHLSSPLPGMKIEKAKGISFAIVSQFSLSGASFSLDGSVSLYSFLYPVLPMFSIGFTSTSLGVSPRLGFGGKTAFPLSMLLDSVPFVRNVSLEASVEGLVEYRSAFVFSGRWSLAASYALSPSFSISLIYSHHSEDGAAAGFAIGGVL